MEDASQCMLDLISATKHGAKELLTIVDGYCESEQSCLEALNDFMRRGLTKAPEVAVGDGVLGFWKVLPQLYGDTRRRRCWMLKTGHVLDKLLKSVQAGAKDNLNQIGWRKQKRSPSCVLRLSCRALAASADHKPDKIDVCSS